MSGVETAQKATQKAAKKAAKNLKKAAALAAQPADPKPLLRGWLHAGTAPLALAAGIVLICLAHGPIAKTASAIYLASSLLLFGHSAIYHRFNWSPRVKQILRRIDHANIFLLIAGTYTPVAVGTLPLEQAMVLLAFTWGGALVGILFRVFWLQAPRGLYVALYIVLGWAAVLFFKPMFEANAPAMILVAVGGLLYTVGALFYGFKWPLRNNRFFGFHELFHAATVTAFFCHWTAALLAMLDPAYLR
ncbi:PAQR family membrane homeostasis protein TrhA [Canibacter zhoujuaniae]|uniref:PAQR family membrane homeostasis protein TrhA n=1 Tax=Canibacter zhoujuaniae TaxID=2708343 RepID=UPI003C7CC4DC